MNPFSLDARQYELVLLNVNAKRFTCVAKHFKVKCHRRLERVSGVMSINIANSGRSLTILCRSISKRTRLLASGMRHCGCGALNQAPPTTEALTTSSPVTLTTMLPLVGLSLTAPTPVDDNACAPGRLVIGIVSASYRHCQWRQQHAVEASSHIIIFQKNSKTTTEIIIVVVVHECLRKVQLAASKWLTVCVAWPLTIWFVLVVQKTCSGQRSPR
jgi:hypothetical protein